ANIAATLSLWRRNFLSGQRSRARDVVAGIAGERQPVDHLRRRDTQDLLYLGLVTHGLDVVRATRRLQHPDSLADQLEHVFVAGDDQDLHAFFGALLRQRADDVVRLEAFFLDDGKAQRLA